MYHKLRKSGSEPRPAEPSVSMGRGPGGAVRRPPTRRELLAVDLGPQVSSPMPGRDLRTKITLHKLVPGHTPRRMARSFPRSRILPGGPYGLGGDLTRQTRSCRCLPTTQARPLDTRLAPLAATRDAPCFARSDCGEAHLECRVVKPRGVSRGAPYFHSQAAAPPEMEHSLLPGHACNRPILPI